MNDTFMKEKPVLPLILSMSLPIAPKSTASRAHAASILMNFDQNVAEK